MNSQDMSTFSRDKHSICSDLCNCSESPEPHLLEVKDNLDSGIKSLELFPKCRKYKKDYGISSKDEDGMDHDEKEYSSNFSPLSEVSTGSALREKFESLIEEDSDNDTETDVESHSEFQDIHKHISSKNDSIFPNAESTQNNSTDTTASVTCSASTLPDERMKQIFNEEEHEDDVEVVILPNRYTFRHDCEAEIISETQVSKSCEEYSTDDDHTINKENVLPLKNCKVGSLDKTSPMTSAGKLQNRMIDEKKNMLAPKTKVQETHKLNFFPTRGYGRSKVKKGKWSLGSKIGHGSFGVVHVGMNERNGSLMAIKCLNIPSSSSSNTMEDLQREIDVMQSLDHPNIVRYMGAEIDHSKHMLYIFQEWVPGGSVSSLIKNFGPFSTTVVRSYLYQILRGLEYLHQNKILHRDIKGGNILVNDQGVAKLSDFGASKKVYVDQEGNGMEYEDMMESMTLRGTPYFMAVEVFEEKYGPKADIWACGCVAFQMIVGVPPWKGLGIKSPVGMYRFLKANKDPPFSFLSRKQMHKNGESVQEIPTLSESLKKLLLRCFQREASRRPSAQQLLTDDFFLEDDPNQSLIEDDEDREKSLSHHNSYDHSNFSPMSQLKKANKCSNHRLRNKTSKSPSKKPSNNNGNNPGSPYFETKHPSGKLGLKQELCRNPNDWPVWAQELAKKENNDGLESYNP
eukprot:CAMPEP_0184872280 /NCGR_PEP_ID=MMETSP0580-20130426/41195_1 /TAXON_ID=1118495 /ORGANISM="Dactyliosolen fragilissimus" /LENGTH=684 /DNA_ID=CAMNT_0027375049 /DNA_START=356 /DNA_END=2406 /DNA_ORIENTATION=-